MTVTTRFAPSPNGQLHWGHALSAITAHDLARAAGGRFLLRIEDIDGPRSHPELAEEFREDLAWLGLSWEEVPAQGTRIARYEAAAERLRAMGLLYPCTCTRAEIAAAAKHIGPAPGSQAGAGPGSASRAGGPVYPGTCRNRTDVPAAPVAWRLDVAKALERTGPLTWTDAIAGEQRADPLATGDPVLVRKGLPASYHLAATLDDAADGVTLVTRGMDLFAASHTHRLLQDLLGLPVPRWHHHRLLLGADGQKLAKRRGSKPLADHRRAGQDGRAWADRLRTGRWPAGISLQND